MQCTDSAVLSQMGEGVCSCLLPPAKMPKTLLLRDLTEEERAENFAIGVYYLCCLMGNVLA